jgi:pyruvate formate lyase activating enzyme
MNIRSFLNSSLNDYSGKISSVIFTSECNFKCPACHAKNLSEMAGQIKEEDVFNYLNSKKDWINAVVLCGGEPTLQPYLIDFSRKLKDRGLAVKLDTNGSNPDVMEELRQEKLVDYVAMDIKGPPYLYSNIAGTQANLGDIEKAMMITAGFPNYEFRTTIVPVIRDNGEIRPLDIKEIIDTAKWIVDATNDNRHKYYLQKFVPRKDGLIDKRLETFPETSLEILLKIKDAVIKCLPNCEMR